MDSDWKARKTWLAHLPKELPEELRTPADIAAFELDSFFTARGISCPYTLALSEELGDAWLLEDSCLTGGPTGILYGAYSLIRCAVAGLPLPVGRQQPYYPLRMLDCWDNMDGTIERGYAGRSLWFEGGSFSYDPARIRQLGRMLASAGINVLCLNNVNVHQPAQQLMGAFLPHLAAFSALLRPFGIRLMVSIDFSSPLSHGLDSADPLDPDVARWWKDQTARVYQAVPDLAGFLVKADSEHQPGPASYGRSHAEGANMLARDRKSVV